MKSDGRRVVAASLAGLALLAAGCLEVGFGRKVSGEELHLRAEIGSYYDQIAAGFAAGNADAIAELFDSAIAKPMTKEEIRAKGRELFGKHGAASFRIHAMEFERVGPASAVVTLTYSVTTRDGAVSFGGTERDKLIQRGGRWYITAWEKLR
ncbi:MAG: hypothetical protein HY552_04395 [Elusimicrobia bacterium]|nr:hypothetical protein [Elusimicrobiota bacterium]